MQKEKEKQKNDILTWQQPTEHKSRIRRHLVTIERKVDDDGDAVQVPDAKGIHSFCT